MSEGSESMMAGLLRRYGWKMKTHAGQRLWRHERHGEVYYDMDSAVRAQFDYLSARLETSEFTLGMWCQSSAGKDGLEPLCAATQKFLSEGRR